MIDARDLKEALDFLEMKTRIKMSSKDWHYGFCFNNDGGVYRYYFFPRVRVRAAE